MARPVDDGRERQPAARVPSRRAVLVTLLVVGAVIGAVCGLASLISETAHT